MAELTPKYDACSLLRDVSVLLHGNPLGISERLLALVLPRTGDPIVVVPAFEEGRMREKLNFAAEVRAWQEDESPTKIAAAALADGDSNGTRRRGGNVGVYFFDHLRSAAPGFECVPADPVTIACRGRNRRTNSS